MGKKYKRKISRILKRRDKEDSFGLSVPSVKFSLFFFIMFMTMIFWYLHG